MTLPMLSFTLVSALLAAAPSSSPEAVGVLAVAPSPAADPDLIETNKELRNELARHLEGVLEPQEVRQLMLGQPPMGMLSALDRSYEEAVAVLKEDHALGMERLKTLIARLERLAESQEVFTQWTRAILRLARARLERASSPKDANVAVAEARDLLEQLLRASPDVVIDPLLYSKKVERLAAEVKKELSEAQTRVLSFTSCPSGTKVHLEGREVGVCPLSLKVTKGRYRVSGRIGALRAQTEVVTVADADVEVRLDFSIAPTMKPEHGPYVLLEPKDAERGIPRAAAWLGMDRVVATTIHRHQDVAYLGAQVFRVWPNATVERQGWLQLTGATPPVDGVADLAAFLVTGKASPRILEKMPELPGAAPLPENVMAGTVARRSDSSARILTWSPVATGVLAIGLGAFAGWKGAVANDNYRKANGMVTGPTGVSLGDAPSYRDHLAAGDAAKRNALIGGIGAGVCAVATGVLGYLAHRQTGEIGPFRF